MEKKSLIIKNFSWDDVEIFMEITSYSNNNQLAILLYEKESWEYYCDLSVNVKDFWKGIEFADYISVDVNNCPNAEEFIKRNQLWELVDYVQSWFVSYPVYKMNGNMLYNYNFDEYSEYMKSHWWGVKKPLSKDANYDEDGNEIETVWDRLRK